MTAFYYDLEQATTGRMADVPAFDTYNVQYQPASSLLDYESTKQQDWVYNMTSVYHFDYSSPSGDVGSWSGSDHDQAYEAASPSSVGQVPHFWQNGALCTESRATEPVQGGEVASSMAAVPSSVAQWRTSHLHQHQDPYPRLPATKPSPPLMPFETSTSASGSPIAAQSAPVVQMPPEQPLPQRAPSFRHDPLSQASQPSAGISMAHEPQHWAAHQPIPPEFRSTYSTLAGNLEFMERLRLESESRKSSALKRPVTSPPAPLVEPIVPSSANLPKDPPFVVPSQAKPRKLAKRVSFPDEPTTQSDSVVGVKRTSPGVADGGKDGPKTAKRSRKNDRSSPSSSAEPAPSDSPSTSHSTPEDPLVVAAEPVAIARYPKNVKEPRKPSLACLFCRERKIGCARPPDGSEDMTCNQCARRNFVCVYMAEKPPRVRKRTAKAKLPAAA